MAIIYAVVEQVVTEICVCELRPYSVQCENYAFEQI